MKAIKLAIFPVTILLLVFLNCQKYEFNNPFDPECPKDLFTPSGFKAVQQGNTIVLTWTQTNKKISGFRINRKVGSGSFSNVNTPGKSETTWTDSNLTGGQLHEYEMEAYAGDNTSNKVTTSVTPSLPPIVNTNPATNPTITTAVLNGSVNANGAAATVTFEYGETTSYGKTVAAVPGSVSGNTLTSVTATITGLNPGTTYHFRVKAVNSSGTTTGTDQYFQTPCLQPVVTTLNASNLTASTLTLNAQVNPNGCSTTVSFDYGETTSYGSNVPATPSPLTGSTTQNVSATINVLPGKVYHFRIVATNSAGTVQGLDVQYIVVCLAPTVNTLSASGLTASGATLNGQVNANGCSSVVSFEYGETTSYGQLATATPSSVTGNTLTSVSAAISGLLPGKIYHYRTKSVNSAGTTIGLDMQFTTLCIAPIVSVQTVNQTPTTATLSALVNPNGCSTNVIFDYGETTSYGSSANGTPSNLTGNGISPVSATISIMPGKTYHFRVRAINSSGTTTSIDYVFTSSCTAPSAIALGPTPITNTTATIYGTVNSNNVNGCTTTVTFEYGLTTLYGSSIAATPGTVTGNQNVQVSAALTGLQPGTGYHYRVSANNGFNTVKSGDMYFVTPEDEPFTSKTQVFLDGFSSVIAANGWDIGQFNYSNGTSFWGYMSGGYYYLFYNYVGYDLIEYTTNITPVVSGKNFEVETTTRIQKSIYDVTSTGIASGAGLAILIGGNWISFYFVDDGTLKARVGNTILVSSRFSALTDSKSLNNLKIARIGTELYLYVNHRYFSKIGYGTGDLTQIGFVVLGGSNYDYLWLQQEGTTKSLRMNNIPVVKDKRPLGPFPVN